MSYDLKAEQVRQWIQFTHKTFPKSTPKSCLIHLRREVGEAIDSITYNDDRDELLEEFADIILCAITAAGKCDFNAVEIIESIKNKMLINLKRDWKENPDGTYSHVKHEPITSPEKLHELCDLVASNEDDVVPFMDELSKVDEITGSNEWIEIYKRADIRILKNKSYYIFERGFKKLYKLRK